MICKSAVSPNFIARFKRLVGLLLFQLPASIPGACTAMLSTAWWKSGHLGIQIVMIGFDNRPALYATRVYLCLLEDSSVLDLDMLVYDSLADRVKHLTCHDWLDRGLFFCSHCIFIDQVV